VTLSAGDGYDIYEWSNGETTQTILANASGQYWVVAYNYSSQTYGSDTVNILIECQPDGTCPEGTSCQDGYCFDDTVDPCDGITCPSGQQCWEGACFDQCSENSCDPGDVCYAGNCFQTADACQGISCASGEVCHEGACYQSCEITDTNLCFDLGPDTVYPSGTTVTLSAGDGYDIYEWSNGETTQTILANASGQYWVVAYNYSSQTYGSDTINVLIECQPDGTCPEGTSCQDGYCFDDTVDPCDGITCPAGQQCWEGACFDQCSENSCDPGDVCYAGNCFQTGDLCEGVTCPEGQICIEGACYEENVTGLLDENTNSNFTIYPNPGANYISVSYKLKNAGKLNISVISVSGKTLLSRAYHYKKPGSYTEEIEGMEKLHSGIYFIQLSGDDTHQLRKWVKKE